jgi:hypothetical protein
MSDEASEKIILAAKHCLTSGNCDDCPLNGHDCGSSPCSDAFARDLVKPAPPASDDVREILEEVRYIQSSDETHCYGYALTYDEAAALITAHVAKETAALTAKVERLRKTRRAPRNADGEGGWTIDYAYLELIQEKMDQKYRTGLEEIESVILANEATVARAALADEEAKS